MAAEDYFPTTWDEEDEPFRPSSTTCNRCGQPGLFWGKLDTVGGWRLHTRSGQLHHCPRTIFQANPERLLAPTTSAFTPSKESIMDKNAVAFIRNDVRTLHCVFLPSEKGNSPPYFTMSREELFAATTNLKEYTYLTTHPTIGAGNFAIVIASNQPKVVFIRSVEDELAIEPNAAFEYSFVVGPIDFTAYTQLLAQNKAIQEALKSSYQASLREGFRQTLLAGLPEDKRNSINLLLSSGQDHA